jgi:acetolactate synthase-1/2/3 large subunit
MMSAIPNMNEAQKHPETGAQVLVRTLEDAGVEFVFGFPGGTIMPVYDALYDSHLKHILCRHEQGVALAADGYARSSGKLGVCMATSGPGATNLVTGIANAFMDSVPMLAITGQVPTAFMGTDAFQEVDIFGVTLPIVKHSFIVRDPDKLQETVLNAMHIACSGRPGPVLLDLPKDVAVAAAIYNPDAMAPEEPDFKRYGQDDLDRAMDLLRNARKPVAYIGGGTVISGASTLVRALVEHHQMPAVATLKALGVLPTSTELFLGMVGMHGSKAANLAVQDCDLLICMGARFDDRVTGKLDEFAPHAQVIHIDIDPAEISKLRPADVSLPGEIKPVIKALIDVPVQETGQWRAACMENKKKHQVRYDYPGDDIYAPLLLKKLSGSFGTDPYICCDVGQHQMWVAQHCLFNTAEKHLSSAGLGTMGYGLPAAIGTCLAHPGKPVVVVSGDGSIMMNIQELATLKRYELPVKIILLDNASLGLVRQWQELFFDGRYSEVDLSCNPDFAAVARGFDIPALTIEKATEIESGLDFLQQMPGPCLLHVKIDPTHNVWPLVPPGHGNQTMLENSQ